MFIKPLYYVKILSSKHQLQMRCASHRDVQGIEIPKVILPKYLYIESIQVRSNEEVNESVFRRGRVEYKGTVGIVSLYRDFKI